MELGYAKNGVSAPLQGNTVYINLHCPAWNKSNYFECLHPTEEKKISGVLHLGIVKDMNQRGVNCDLFSVSSWRLVTLHGGHFVVVYTTLCQNSKGEHRLKKFGEPYFKCKSHYVQRVFGTLLFS